MVPVKITVPEFCTTTAPEPAIVPEKVPVVGWSNTTLPLLVIEPCKLVVLPCNVPDETVVPPE